MPYQVSVGSQVVEFPDSVSQEEAQKILADKFPPTGQDIANALQDPNFTPTQEQYQLFEDYNKTRQTDWLQSLLTAADTVVQTAGAAGKAALTTGAAFNPKNYVEGLAQGTAQLYGLVAQSQDPDSALFKLNNLISGTGTLENRYGQFLEARQFNKDLDAYAKGDMSIMFKPEDLNPEFVQGVAMVADPTMFVPGVGQLLGAEKVAAKAVGKAVGVAGKGVQAISKPVERLSAATGRFVTEATGISPEALRGAATTSGVLAATGVGPAIGAVGAVPFIAEAATDVGRALETAGAQAGRAPTRIGALEAVGAIPEANMRQRIIGTIGRYGGDAALRTALAGTAGTLEGAALGGALGYLSGGEEGAASGIGSGGVAGALGSLGARGLQTLTGSEAKAARLNDLTTYIDTLAPEKKAAYQSVQERFGTDTAANLMDLESLIKGTRGDIGVEILRGDEFQKRAGVTARGVVPDENAATPRILINVDAMPKVKGDSPIYTLGHELLHALAKTKQFQGDVTGFVETLTGAYVPNPDGTVRLVSEGQYSPAKVEQLFNDYVKQLPEDARANVISANPTASDRAVYVGEELAAEQVGRILSSQKPDAFLRGFGSTRQNFTDMLLLQEASRVGSKIGQLIERTFGITPTDSVLFPEIKNASPALDAALRRLLKARENIDEALLNADYQKSFKIDQKAISDPVAADYAVRGGFAERLPTGEVRLLTNGELLQRETRDVTALKQIIDGLPGAKIDINGEVVGDLSPEQLDAIKGSSVSSQMKQRYEMANRGINEGRALFVEYYPATEKVQDPTSKRWRTKYASRRVTFREMLMYNLLFSKENNAYVRAIDLTQVRKSLQRSIRPDGSVGGLWNNVGEFLGELNAYLSNLDRKENAIPSRKIFGPDKAEFFGNFMNSAEKGGSEFIHNFRLDRMGQMDPSDFRAKFSEGAYKKMKDRFMPAGSVGEEQAWKSGAGFTILTSGNKFRLYGPEGKLLGIYDSAEQAQRKANATQARIQSEIDQQQRLAGDEGRQTAEAGGRNRPVSSTQGGQEGRQALRQVRQAGDVGARFMPSDAEYLSAVEAGDTAKAQELVDQAAKAAGYTMNAWHSTFAPNFNEFDMSRAGTGTGGWLPVRGMFFSVNRDHSSHLPEDTTGLRRMKVSLKLENPLKVANADALEKALGDDYDQRPDDGLKRLKELGFDSVILAGGDEIIATSPSQIKSADPITRDDAGNIIPLSQRFQSTSPDIRYMPAESPEQGFYSKLERVIDSEIKGSSIPVDQLKAIIRNRGVKAEEMKWSNVDLYIDRLAKYYGGKVPKNELLRMLRNTRPNFGVMEGEPKWVYNDESGTYTFDTKDEAEAYRDNSIDNLESIYSDGWSVEEIPEEEGGGFRVVDEYDNPARPVKSDSGREVWRFDDSYSTEKEARIAMVDGARYAAEALTPDIYQESIPPDFKEWSLPGGTNYREIAFAGTSIKPWTGASQHDFEALGNSTAVGNAARIGHMRVDDRSDATGKQGLFIQEFQSDRHQQGREKGYGAEGIPDAPFRKDWAVQMFKRALKDAVDRQMKWIGWTDGDTQAQRFDLSQQVEYIDYRRIGSDKYDVAVVGKNGSELFSETGINQNRVSDVVGKEIADKMAKGEGQSGGGRMTLRGLDLKIGGEGMKAFYDKILPNEIGKYIKQWGAKVQKDQLKFETTPFWKIAITPEIANAVRQGQERYMPAPVPDPSIPGAYSMSGYRILPGKTKGKLRVYSPNGSLVGVVGSVDDAQRMIQKKLK